MFRHIAKPFDAGRLEFDIGIEAACHCLMNDGLLLLVQQLDEPPLGVDEMVDAAVLCSEILDDGGLFRDWRNKNQHPLEVYKTEVLTKAGTKAIKNFHEV